MPLKLASLIGALCIAVAFVAYRSAAVTDSTPSETDPPVSPADPDDTIIESKLQLATFGSGCFWCTEAVFLELRGVHKVVSGYTGGQVENPTYEQVCTGLTGHAEVIQVSFDPDTISFPELLEVFWKTHDPTTLNQQGADRGTQYRSAIFYHNEEQREAAERYKQKLDESGAFGDPIVTEITVFEKLYPAEAYHQNYYNRKPNEGYCSYVIGPKLDKFRDVFRDKLKAN